MSYMKRLTVPRSWSIEKKANVWTTKPNPGPHSLDLSIPISTVLRDYLKICDKVKEAKKIVNDGLVQVDGRIVRKHKWGVGLMDVFSIPSTKTYFRIILDKNFLIDKKNKMNTFVIAGGVASNLSIRKNLIKLAKESLCDESCKSNAANNPLPRALLTTSLYSS